MGRANSKHVHSGRNIRDVLDRMEPDLRLLEGTVVVLRSLAETSDSIEPIALEALGHLSGETLQRIIGCWREAMDDLT